MHYTYNNNLDSVLKRSSPVTWMSECGITNLSNAWPIKYTLRFYVFGEVDLVDTAYKLHIQRRELLTVVQRKVPPFSLPFSLS